MYAGFTEDMKYVAAAWNKKLLVLKDERKREIMEGSAFPEMMEQWYLELEQEEEFERARCVG